MEPCGSTLPIESGFAITMAIQSARVARERDKAVAAERAAAEQRNARRFLSNMRP